MTGVPSFTRLIQIRVDDQVCRSPQGSLIDRARVGKEVSSRLKLLGLSLSLAKRA